MFITLLILEIRSLLWEMTANKIEAAAEVQADPHVSSRMYRNHIFSTGFFPALSQKIQVLQQ